MKFTAILASSFPPATCRARSAFGRGRRVTPRNLLPRAFVWINCRLCRRRRSTPTGVVSIQAKGAGTFDNPQLDATLQIPQIDIQNQKIADVNLQMNVANHLATANLPSAAVGTQIKANAKVNLTGDYAADATLDTQAIPLQPIFADLCSRPGCGFNRTDRGARHPPRSAQKQETVWKRTSRFQPEAGLQQYHPVSGDRSHPGRLQGHRITLQRSGLKGTDTDLQFSGVDVHSEDAPDLSAAVGHGESANRASCLNPTSEAPESSNSISIPMERRTVPTSPARSISSMQTLPAAICPSACSTETACSR